VRRAARPERADDPVKGQGERPAGGGRQSRSPAAHSLGSSGGAAPALGPCTPAEVNRRDLLGRTVLHLLVASLEPVALEFLHALLAHPSVNCNVQDAESGAWRWHAARAY